MTLLTRTELLNNQILVTFLVFESDQRTSSQANRLVGTGLEDSPSNRLNNSNSVHYSYYSTDVC